jgi:ribosomal protein S18
MMAIGSRSLSGVSGDDAGSSSSGDKDGAAPEEFYDDDVEKEKEFMDMISAIARGGEGLGGLTTSKDTFSFDKVDAVDHSNIPTGIVETLKEVARGNSEMPRGEQAPEAEGNAMEMVSDLLMNDDLAEHYGDIGLNSNSLMPPEYMNYTVPWKKSNKLSNSSSVPSNNFVKRTAKEGFAHDNQGNRSCPGKRQRKGKTDELGCHVIDLDKLTPFALLTLRRFISVDSEILGRKDTRLCAKCQRSVAKTIKRARNMGILGHIDEYVIQDSSPLQRGKTYHKQTAAAGAAAGGGVSKTIL